MSQLLTDLPEPEILVSLEPEELAARLLFVVRKHDGEKAFTFMRYSNAIVEHARTHNQAWGRLVDQIEVAFAEAWAWLEAQGLVIPEPGTNGQHGWRRLSRRARSFETEQQFADYSAARMLPKAILHPSIAEKVWVSFVRGEYDVAVFQAMKQVEIAVRENSSPPSGATLGVKLARHAFQPGSGPLTDTDAESGEQQAMMDLFAGAIGTFKNPYSHRDVGIKDPIEAMEQIMIASHLLRMASPPGQPSSRF